MKCLGVQNSMNRKKDFHIYIICMYF